MRPENVRGPRSWWAGEMATEHDRAGKVRPMLTLGDDGALWNVSDRTFSCSHSPGFSAGMPPIDCVRDLVCHVDESRIPTTAAALPTTGVESTLHLVLRLRGGMMQESSCRRDWLIDSGVDGHQVMTEMPLTLPGHDNEGDPKTVRIHLDDTVEAVTQRVQQISNALAAIREAQRQLNDLEDHIDD